jgi:DNA polymerase-1
MKLLLVDGSALLHRAYHAYPPLTTKTGEIVGAVYGVASMLISALESERPSHVLVAWDLPKPTFRHEKYVGYKAQRPKADEEMVTQIPTVKEVIEAMGIAQLAVEGYEADDIIGTMATKFSNPKFSNSQITEVVILTGDQDAMQLVSETVHVLTPPKGKEPAKVYDPDAVWNKYGVKAEQIVDYKALVGDHSDNIPGVAGIGPKTAAGLLKQFGTLERVYAALNSKSQIQNFKLGDQTAQKLIDGKESAWLSQELSQIVTDMPLSITLEELVYTDIRTPAFQDMLESLGFRSLVKRLWKETSHETPSKAKHDTNQMGLF